MERFNALGITCLLTLSAVFLFVIAMNSANAENYFSIDTIKVNRKAVSHLSLVPGKDTIFAVVIRNQEPSMSSIIIYDLEGNVLSENDLTEQLFCMDVSADGARAAAGSTGHGGNSTLFIISPVDGDSLRKMSVGHGGLYALSFSVDGTYLAVGTGDGTLIIYDTASYEVHREIDLGDPVLAAQFSPDGNTIAAGTSKGELVLYDMNSGNEERKNVFTDYINSVLWVNSTRIVACGAEGILKVLDPDLDQLGVLNAHNKEVFCTCGHVGERYVFSGGKDGKLVVWDMTDLSVESEHGSAEYWVYCCDSSSDGRYLCYGTSKSDIFVFAIDPDSDGYPLKSDAFPQDPAASSDSDGDGYPDGWNPGKGQKDSTGGITHIDSYPQDPAASLDGDGDGVPDAWNTGKSPSDSTSNLTELDAFPDDAAASIDSDGDGAPESWNPGFSRSDSTTGLALDEFPDDPGEWADSDWPMADGLGDNGDWLPGINNYFFYLVDFIFVIVIAVFTIRWYMKRTEESELVEFRPSGESERVEVRAISLGEDASMPGKPVKGAIREIIPNYVMTHKVGAGAFATVYAAKGLEVDRVAVKLPKMLEETLDSSVYDKFEAESSIWKKLGHGNIVKIHETGLEPIPYIVMELMEGGSLRQLMDRRRLTVHESVRIMLGILDALSYAHRMATVHRDIKPENVLFTADGVPKITDWGIGKLMVSESMTQTSGSKGTLFYSAPEQVSKKEYGEVDWACDLFQAGIVFYEMLTGENPFRAEDSAEVIAKILYGEVSPPSSRNPDVPRVLDIIVMKSLEKAKRKRWRSADVMYDRLRELEMED